MRGGQMHLVQTLIWIKYGMTEDHASFFLPLFSLCPMLQFATVCVGAVCMCVTPDSDAERGSDLLIQYLDSNV